MVPVVLVCLATPEAIMSATSVVVLCSWLEHRIAVACCSIIRIMLGGMVRLNDDCMSYDDRALLEQ